MTCRTCAIIKGLMLANDIPAPVVEAAMPVVAMAEKKVKRKASAYSKRYGRAFKKVASKYKTKSGSWMKNGFIRAQKEAHRIARRG